MSRNSHDGMAFYLTGLVIGILSTVLVLVVDMPVWTVPVCMFVSTAIGFVAVDTVRRRITARSYTFASTGSYTLRRDDPWRGR